MKKQNFFSSFDMFVLLLIDESLPSLSTGFSDAPLLAFRRANLQIVNIGNINDPEKTKADKEKKARVNFSPLAGQDNGPQGCVAE